MKFKSDIKFRKFYIDENFMGYAPVINGKYIENVVSVTFDTNANTIPTATIVLYLNEDDIE